MWSVQNAFVLTGRKGTQFTSTKTHKQHDFSDKFTEQDGFQIALAIIDLSNIDDHYLDNEGRPLEEYANIEIRASGWNITGEYEGEELKYHPCTDEELGLDSSSNSKFYPIHGEDLDTVEKARASFICFDQSELEIANQFDSAVATYLDIKVRVPDKQCTNSKSILHACETSLEY